MNWPEWPRAPGAVAHTLGQHATAPQGNRLLASTRFTSQRWRSHDVTGMSSRQARLRWLGWAEKTSATCWRGHGCFARRSCWS